MSQPVHPPQPHGGPGYPPPPPPPPPRRKRRLVLKLVLLGVAALVVAGIFAAVRGPAPVRVPETGDVVAAGALSPFDLRPGDCYNTKELPPPVPRAGQPTGVPYVPGDGQGISTVEVVPCTSAHSDQVISKVSYGPTETLAAVLGGKAGPDCNAQFQEKLDAAVFDDPTLRRGQLVPRTELTWTRYRVIACVVFSDQPIARSLLR